MNRRTAAILIAVTATSGIAQETPRRNNAAHAPKGAKYLETGGDRKLEIVYKSIAGRDLKLSGDCLYSRWRMGRR